MTDLNALAQKLDALSAKDDVFEGGVRVISRAGMHPPINAMLRVIDETVLERRLDFAAGETVISVAAAGRRLRGLVAVSPATDAAAQLIGTTLSRQEPEILERVFALLSDALDGATNVTVSSLASEPFGTGGERGITAVGLAEMWQIELDAMPLTPIARFLKANMPAFSAVLHVSAGEVLASDGDVAGLQSIWDTQVDAFLQAQEQLPGHQDGPKLVCLEGALEGDGAAALALAGDDAALMVYDPAQLGALHASWQSIFS